VFKLHAFVLACVCGLIIKIDRPEDTDYTKWLGPGYKEAQMKNRKPGFRPSTYISNHMGVADGLVYLMALSGDISFVAMEETKKMPLIGDCIRITEGLFVPRGGTKESKE
jgi:hypothetical protein